MLFSHKAFEMPNPSAPLLRKFVGSRVAHIHRAVRASAPTSSSTAFFAHTPLDVQCCTTLNSPCPISRLSTPSNKSPSPHPPIPLTSYTPISTHLTGPYPACTEHSRSRLCISDILHVVQRHVGDAHRFKVSNSSARLKRAGGVCGVLVSDSDGGPKHQLGMRLSCENRGCRKTWDKISLMCITGSIYNGVKT